MATSKLLANSDRWGDDGVFSRDLIDLAMMRPSLGLLRQAVAKAEQAYGRGPYQGDKQDANPPWLVGTMHAGHGDQHTQGTTAAKGSYASVSASLMLDQSFWTESCLGTAESTGTIAAVKRVYSVAARLAS